MLAGTVVAAASLSRRFVALVRGDDQLRAVVLGRRLGRLERLAVPLDDLGPLPDDDLLLADLAPLFYDRGDLLCRIGPDWWRLAPGSEPAQEEVVAVGTGAQIDVPHIVRLDPLGHFYDGTRAIGHGVPPGALRVAGGGHGVAWSVDERRHVRAAEACTIHVPRGLRGHGIVLDRQSGPALVGRSQGGALIRLHARSATKTLTRWSGLALDHAVHPLQPLIAVQRDEGTIEIGDLTTGSC